MAHRDRPVRAWAAPEKYGQFRPGNGLPASVGGTPEKAATKRAPERRHLSESRRVARRLHQAILEAV